MVGTTSEATAVCKIEDTSETMLVSRLVASVAAESTSEAAARTDVSVMVGVIVGPRIEVTSETMLVKRLVASVTAE